MELIVFAMVVGAALTVARLVGPALAAVVVLVFGSALFLSLLA